jgi:hypothetical protein
MAAASYLTYQRDYAYQASEAGRATRSFESPIHSPGRAATARWA